MCSVQAPATIMQCAHLLRHGVVDFSRFVDLQDNQTDPHFNLTTFPHQNQLYKEFESSLNLLSIIHTQKTDRNRLKAINKDNTAEQI